MASDATIPFGSLALASVLVEANGLEGLDDSLTMVEVDEERPKVFARGARWVSLSFFVSFHDILMDCVE